MIEMGVLNLILIVLCVNLVVVSSKIVSLDEKWVCFVKNSCQECLKLPACSWCSSKNKCFPESDGAIGESCGNETIRSTDYGFSLEHNADCACARGQMEDHCHHPDVADAVKCSGRGTCLCGRCVCDAPDRDNPTKFPFLLRISTRMKKVRQKCLNTSTFCQLPNKMVMGEYCEFDNFSCQGSKCNEGPYSLTQPRSLDDENLSKLAEEEQPIED